MNRRVDAAALQTSATFERPMDRLIWAAWRAFWVGLGASLVLIAQSVLAPPPALSTAPAEPVVDPIEQPVAAPARAKSADPILSRNPFDSTRGKSVARVRNES